MQELKEIREHMSGNIEAIKTYLCDEADYLLNFNEPKIGRESLHLPGNDFVDRILTDSDRSTQVLRNLKAMFNHGRLAGTGYLSILPVDQGIEQENSAEYYP